MQPTPTGRRPALAIWALFSANAISMVGNMLAFVAIPWFVLQTTGSVARTGVTAFISALAAVLAGFFGGAFVDRLGFKRMSIFADLASAVAFALIPLLYATIGLQFWQLLVLVFAGNLLDSPGTTAREALIPDLAQMAGMSLERASAGIQSVERGARLLGAPLAGILIANMGTNNVLWLDALSFILSAAIVLFTVPLNRAATAPKPSQRYFDELKVGLQFILHDRLILAIVAIVMVGNFLDAPMGGVIYPVYVKKFFGSALDLGLIIGVGGGGALIGALLFAAFGQRFSRRAIFFGGFALATLHFWILAFVPSLPVILAAQLISGLGAGPLNPIISTIEYERVPVEMRGRVFGAITSSAYIAIPLGVLLGSSSLAWLDIRLVIALIGASYLVAIFAGFLSPAARTMDMKSPQA